MIDAVLDATHLRGTPRSARLSDISLVLGQIADNKMPRDKVKLTKHRTRRVR
jgi:hypothetical protein